MNINNTFMSTLAISGAGNSATVPSTIVGNKLYNGIELKSLLDSDKNIVETIEKLPTIAGNTFYGAAYTVYDWTEAESDFAKENQYGKLSALIWNLDAEEYLLSAGELSVIAKTNYGSNGNYLSYRIDLFSIAKGGDKTLAAVLFAAPNSSFVDSVVDTQEEQ